MQNALLFFDVEWRQADGAFAERILAHPPLARYAHSLAHERVFARHTLTEAEEKLAAEKRLTGISAFQRLFDERTSRLRQTMTVDGERKEMNETELLALLYHEDRGVRRRAQVAMTKALQDDATFSLSSSTSRRKRRPSRTACGTSPIRCRRATWETRLTTPRPMPCSTR